MDKFFINGVEISPPDGFEWNTKKDIISSSGGRTFDGELRVDKRIRMIICKIEEAFGLELYDWQKAYLFGGECDFITGRFNGLENMVTIIKIGS